MRDARIGRLRPLPSRIRKKRTHRVDVAVIGRPFDGALRGAGSKQLGEEREEPAAGREPAVKLIGIDAPMIGIERAQAGLLVDGVEGALRLPGERVVFDQRRAEIRRFEPQARAVDRLGRVVERRHLEAGGAERLDFMSRAASGHENAARSQRAVGEPRTELQVGGAAVPRRLARLEAFVPEFAGRPGHAYMLLRYCPPTSNSALVICPSEHTRTVFISSANTLPSSITVCLSFASAAGGRLRVSLVEFGEA